jgi:hypothetical protein
MIKVEKVCLAHLRHMVPHVSTAEEENSEVVTPSHSCLQLELIHSVTDHSPLAM